MAVNKMVAKVLRDCSPELADLLLNPAFCDRTSRNDHRISRWCAFWNLVGARAQMPAGHVCLWIDPKTGRHCGVPIKKRSGKIEMCRKHVAPHLAAVKRGEQVLQLYRPKYVEVRE